MAERFLAGARVGDVRESIVRKAATIGPDSSIPELLEKILEDPRSRHVYVVDASGILIGSVRLNSVIRHLFPHSTMHGRGDGVSALALAERLTAKNVRDVMNSSPVSANDDTTIPEVAKSMEREGVNELPVVDTRDRVVGEINFLEIITEYLKIRKRLLGPDA